MRRFIRLFVLALIAGCVALAIVNHVADAQQFYPGAPTSGNLPTITVSGGATGAGTGGTVSVTLNLGDGAALDGQLPNGFQQPQTMGGSVGGTTAAATVLQGDGTGTSQYGAGTTFTQKANEVLWQFADGGGSVSYGYGVDITSASTYTNCAVLTPSAALQTSNSAGVVTCTILCQDVTAFLDAGTATNGHASSGTLSFQWNQAGLDAGGLTVNAGSLVPLFTNTLAIGAQGILDGGSVYTQVEYTTASVYAHCVCSCTGTVVGPN